MVYCDSVRAWEYVDSFRVWVDADADCRTAGSGWVLGAGEPDEPGCEYTLATLGARELVLPPTLGVREWLRAGRGGGGCPRSRREAKPVLCEDGLRSCTCGGLCC